MGFCSFLYSLPHISVRLQDPFTSVWKWGQHGPPKLLYPTTTLYSVTTEELFAKQSFYFMVDRTEGSMSYFLITKLGQWMTYVILTTVSHDSAVSELFGASGIFHPADMIQPFSSALSSYKISSFLLWSNKLYFAVRLLNLISAVYLSLCSSVQISQPYRSDGIDNIL